MRIDWTTFALQAINLLILIGILGRFLFRPVADMIERRRAEAVRLLADAEAEKSKAQTARASVEAEAQAIEAKRAAALSDLAKDVEAQRQTLLAAANAEAADVVAKGRDEAQRARTESAVATRREAGDLALGIAEKLLARLPDAVRTAGFVDGLAAAVAALPEASRAEIGDDAALTLKSARPLDEEERQDLRAKFAEMLGRRVELSFVVDEKLIAGLELDAPHARVANSWRADLDAIAKEFARDA
jgi:F-type H+-transporting ATPase subunit b